jgi:methionyl-tRNA formyltransferase
MSARNFLVVGCKPWNRRVFDTEIRRLPGKWTYIGAREELTVEAVRALKPRYIFFLHWSWRVPEELVRDFECVCFHMTDVPYGRGGSPLQNLIVRGHRATKLTALRMTESFDAGPVYLKAPLSLEGNAEEILIRASALSAEMVKTIVRRHPKPGAQRGAATIFKRRGPEESTIPQQPTLRALHDFIRMLDAEGYPRAFLDHAGFRYEFRRAALYDGRVVADVTITPLANTGTKSES